MHAGAGGVGSLAIQLAKLWGAGRVIATASSDEKRKQVLELGADAAIDGTPEGLKDRIIEANGGKPVDIVLEMVGGWTFDESFAALARFGRLVTFGAASRAVRRADRPEPVDEGLEDDRRLLAGRLLRQPRVARRSAGRTVRL